MMNVLLLAPAVTAILGGVAAVTAASALLFETRRLRARYTP